MRRHTLIGLLLTALAYADDVFAANELCGQTVTTDTTLTADQTCTGDGLTLGADGVTIDLGGFTLSGDRDSGDIGIDLNHHSRITIRNGTIRSFAVGIQSEDLDIESVKISNVTVRDSLTIGGSVFGCGLAVTHSSFINNVQEGLSVAAVCAKGIVVDSCAFVGNGGSAGLQFSTGEKGKITKSLATRNLQHGVLFTGRHMDVRSNTIGGNGKHGVVGIGQVIDVTIAKNVIVGNDDDGVHFDVQNVNVPNFVAANLIAGNGGNGVDVRGDTTSVNVVGNRLIGNGGDGVKIESTAANVVKGNTAIGNGGSGFLATNAVTTFASNVANGNAASGIFAASAIDGGGNKARANGSTQCSAAIACPPAFVPKAGSDLAFCQTQVNHSIKLDEDPPFCAGTDGLVVVADDLTIDLNGHRYRGDRSGGTIGIDVGGHKNVTIKNGIVQGFATGISSTSSADRLKILNVEIRDSVDLGIDVAGGGAVISKSVIVRNSGPGVILRDVASAAKISSSFVVGNTGDGVTSEAPDGSISEVTSAGNTGAGIRLTNGGRGKVQGGIVSADQGDGILIDGSYGRSAPPSIVKKVFVVGNGDRGIALESNSVAMTLDANLVIGNGGDGAPGIGLRNSPEDTLIKKNALVGNFFEGLLIAPSVVAATSIVQNVAIGNVVGFQTFFPGMITVTKNTAVGNGFQGIETLGATDGGGNKAHDNGAEPQCAQEIACN